MTTRVFHNAPQKMGKIAEMTMIVINKPTRNIFRYVWRAAALSLRTFRGSHDDWHYRQQYQIGHVEYWNPRLWLDCPTSSPRNTVAFGQPSRPESLARFDIGEGGLTSEALESCVVVNSVVTRHRTLFTHRNVTQVTAIRRPKIPFEKCPYLDFFRACGAISVGMLRVTQSTKWDSTLQ